MANCVTPDLGRMKAVGLFLADECLRPIYGPGAGYVDDCFAALSTTDNMDDGEDFTRRCADGTIKKFVKGTRSLQDIEVNVDFNWLDPDWVAQAGGASPIEHDGEVIGWSDCTRSKFNVIVVIWQEIFSDTACDPNAPDTPPSDYVRIYPLKDARLTEEGDPGAEDNYIRLTGNTTDSNAMGSGPIPLARNPVDGTAEWLTNCLPSCHRFRFIGAQAPTTCGALDTVAPDVPCVEESPAA